MKDFQLRLLALFHEEKARFMAYARRRIQGLGSLDPEDAVSEVLETLLERGDLVEGAENLAAYAYRALGNRILDARRRESRTSRDGDLDRLASGDPDPHQAFQAAQTRHRVRKAIAALGPRERAVWLATEVEGQSFRDLSLRWGEPLGTLLSRKSRATAKLRRHLNDLQPSRR